MAKYDFDDEDGVWRTVGGRRIFIREGQSLGDAMKNSGKFKSAKKGKSDYQAKQNDLSDEDKENLKRLEKSIMEDKETGNTANRMKAIADQERYDRLHDRYEEQGY